MPYLVLSVGQCSPDDSRLAHFLREACQAVLERAATATVARQKLVTGSYDLILANRIFDSDGDSGIDFIADLRAAGIATPTMLVSDYADAQQAAVAHGALPGFGKSQISSPTARSLLASALSRTSP